jgi:hypothetical protein
MCQPSFDQNIYKVPFLFHVISLGRNWRIDNFEDLIELRISLIKEIRGLIEETSKFGVN